MVTIKSHKEIELMKDVCKIVAEFYEQLEKKVRPGIYMCQCHLYRNLMISFSKKET